MKFLQNVLSITLKPVLALQAHRATECCCISFEENGHLHRPKEQDRPAIKLFGHYALQAQDWDFAISEKEPSPLRTYVFVGLRAADTILQYSILQHKWGSQIIQSLGGSVVPFIAPRDFALAYLGLGPYPAILSAIALGSSTKQIAWVLGISEQEMTPAAALIIGAFTTAFNTLNTMLSLWTLTSAGAADGYAVSVDQGCDYLESYADVRIGALHRWYRY